jgi:hypothetical protein
VEEHREVATVTYFSRRDEVWKRYWKLWRARLWKLHLLIFLALAVLSDLLLFGGTPSSLEDWLVVGIVALAPLGMLIVHPQLRFKPQRRVLTIDDAGIATTLGERSGQVGWDEIAAIRDEGNLLVIERYNLNAFIIPRRAFSSDHERVEFRDLAMVFLAASALSDPRNKSGQTVEVAFPLT